MRFAFTALLLLAATTVRAGEEPQSVLTNPPAETTSAPTVQVVCVEPIVVATEAETRCRSRVCRGLVRRGTVEVSRTVVRTVTRPVGRVCGAFGCR
jgi:hypothetical protein